MGRSRGARDGTAVPNGTIHNPKLIGMASNKDWWKQPAWSFMVGGVDWRLRARRLLTARCHLQG